MAVNFNAQQFDDTFRSHRLNNWEVPRGRGKVNEDTIHLGTLTARKPGSRTGFIVDERGHLLPGVPKIKNAFNTAPQVFELSAPRWPNNPLYKSTPRATGGYKGIQTDYLPQTTVTLKTVVFPGSKERLYT